MAMRSILNYVAYPVLAAAGEGVALDYASRSGDILTGLAILTVSAAPLAKTTADNIALYAMQA